MSYRGGYFSKLREKYSDDQISKIISVTSNSTWYINAKCGVGETRTDPQSLIQRNSEYFYHSIKNNISKIIFDMGTSVKIIGFAMKAAVSDCCWLKAYSLKGSNNEETWNFIKYNNNNDLFHDNNDWHYYRTGIHKYRYYGIFQDPDVSLAGCKEAYFALHGVDFVEFPESKNTCKPRVPLFNKNILFCILIEK